MKDSTEGAVMRQYSEHASKTTVCKQRKREQERERENSSNNGTTEQ
jgi:hypothetical protein